ncbi:MAG: extracellular solute-binding protein [Lachnospiraceae bacterium]|nr:extracellular solute-binding protein [Lachnospiraceae bacterium]
MKRWKKFISTVLIVALVISLAGCSGSSSGDGITLVDLKDALSGDTSASGSASSGSDYVFSETVLEDMNAYAEVGDGGIFYNMEVYDDTIYLVYARNGRRLGTSTGNLLYYSSWDLNGNQLSDVMFLDTGAQASYRELDATLKGYMGESWISADGILYYFTQIQSLVENGSSQSSYDYEGTLLKAINTDGTELFSVDVSDWTEIGDGAYLYFYFLTSQEDDVLTVWDGEVIYHLDFNGNLLSATEAEESFHGQQSPLFYAQGMPVFEIYDSESGSYTYQLLDVTTGQSAGEVDLMDNFTKYTSYNANNQGYIYAGSESGYDLILSDSYGVYGYDFGDSQETEIISYQSSDLSVYLMNEIVYLSPQRVLVCYVGYGDYDRFAILDKVNSSDVQEKVELQLAVYGTNYDGVEINRIVSEFNESSDTYRIVVVDYSEYATSEEPDAGITRLNNEIMAGEGPDLFFNGLEGSFDFDSYAKQGILADFYELMENDPDFEKSDYLENVFEAYEKDGCLYELVPEFQLFTYLGKYSIFGEEALTWDRLEKIMAAYPDADLFGTDSSGQNSAESLLYQSFYFCYEDFIDEEAGTCSFTSEAFLKLLEFIAENEQDDEVRGDSRQYIEDRALLYQYTIDSVSYLNYYNYGIFAEDFTAVGFPSESGTSAVIIASGSFAISNSGNVEAAWEFVKMFLSKEEQMPDDDMLFSYPIPVLKAAVRELTDRMTQQPYDTINGEKVYEAYETSVGGVTMEIEPVTQEVADRWYDYLCTVNRKLNWNFNDVMGIVLEETGAYFAGQKSAQAVAEIIQSRVGLMLSEEQ